jgi:orotate phosphoribosyltransferase
LTQRAGLGPAEIDALLRSTGALLEGHFRLTSGRHSPTYIEKFRIMEDPPATTALCGMIADRYRDAGATLVVGPAVGGVILPTRRRSSWACGRSSRRRGLRAS